jgi:hypothetical protein
LTKITNVAAGKLKNESTTRAFAKFQTSMMIVLKKAAVLVKPRKGVFHNNAGTIFLRARRCALFGH